MLIRLGRAVSDGAYKALSFPYFFFFQAEDGIRYLVRSRGLGDVYKRQILRSVDAKNNDGRAALPF